MKFTLEPAYVLHAKPYRETSLIIEFFTLNQGRHSIVARSARGMRSRFKGTLQPFAPLLITCVGKTELLQLLTAEPNGPPYFLQGNMLFIGLYLNELLMRLLHRADSYPSLYTYYQDTLGELTLFPQHSAQILRRFELILLTQLGYGMQLNKENDGTAIRADYYYRFRLEQGFTVCKQSSGESNIFQGAHLLAIEENDYQNADVLRTSRRLMRLAIGALLGDYKIRTRELFDKT